MIEVNHLHKEYPIGRKRLTALQNITFDIKQGETLGLVGESGCGKSTLGRCLLHLERASRGEVLYRGKNLFSFTPKELFAFRRQAQMIFQDPYSSLNPRMTAGDIIAEPLLIHNVMNPSAIPQELHRLINLVGLGDSSLARFPHEFSGGQRQRIGIARALALQPQFLVCDEPISALDISTQAQIVNLLKSLQQEFGLTYLFIAHDLAMVKYLSDRVAVMYLGHIVEMAPTEQLYQAPQHPYTQALLRVFTRTGPPPLGEVPSALHPPKGCPFAGRCPHAMPLCHETLPQLKEITPGHSAACHLVSS